MFKTFLPCSLVIYSFWNPHRPHVPGWHSFCSLPGRKQSNHHHSGARCICPHFGSFSKLSIQNGPFGVSTPPKKSTNNMDVLFCTSLSFVCLRCFFYFLPWSITIEPSYWRIFFMFCPSIYIMQIQVIESSLQRHRISHGIFRWNLKT